MWKNKSENDNIHYFITQHDCKATNAFVKGKSLIFEFNDGFWVSSLDERNTYKETVKTNRSEIEICDFEDSRVYIFKDIRFFRRLVCTKRSLISLEKLIDYIHRRKWKLEFIYEYHNAGSVLYNCWIWKKHKPYHMECQIEIDCSKIEYHWNDLRRERKW